MHFNWKKMAITSVATLSMATSYAIPPDPCEPVAEPVCCIAPAPGPFAFAYPYDLGLNCPRDFYVHVDGLAFQAKQDGMDIAIEDTSAAVIPTGPISYGRVYGFSSDRSNWDYNPGMRFGIGFYLDHDAWSVDFNWTWVNITNYRHVDAGDGATLIPLWLLGSSNTVFGTSANAVWKASYNMLDLSIGKPYYVSRYLVLSPLFGIRGGTIDQHFSVDYGITSAGAPFNVTHHGRKNDFRGVGARVGINSDWILGKGWWLFSNFSASMLAGKFDIDQSLVVGADGFDVESEYYQNVPNMEMAIGFAWSHNFDCNRYRVSLRAAYEFIQWWNQLNMRRFYSGEPGYANSVVKGDLSMNGFSLRLQIDI